MTAPYRSGPFQALDLRFEIEFDDRETSLAIARTFDCMRTDGLASIVYGVRTEGPYAAFVGQEERAFLEPDEVLPWLLWRINRDVVASVDVPVIHGAATTFSGSTVLCCGHSGAGKSTLVAGLVASGFGYVTDEAIACDERGRVRGWTRPLALHRRSLDLLEEHFGSRIQDAMPVGAHGERLVRPDALGLVERGELPAVGTVILLEGRTEGGSESSAGPVPLSPAEALVAMTPHILAPSRSGETTLRNIAALFGTARAWRVPRRPLPEMVDAVRAAVHQPRSAHYFD